MASAAKNSLLLYCSQDVDGQRISVTGTISTPVGSPPKEGWPLITWTHGTTGLVAGCAPSLDHSGASEHRALSNTRAMLDDYVKRGYAVALTDYEGLGGSSSIHPHLQGKSEAHSALDIMRAARELDPNIGTRYLAMGHSQGGHAALFTAHYGPSYAPEFELVGAVALAPVAQFGEYISAVIKSEVPSPAIVFVMYFLYSAAMIRPEIDLNRILTLEAIAHLDELCQECISTTLARGYWTSCIPKDQILPGADLSKVLMLAHECDPTRLHITTPTLIMQGSQDVAILPRITDALACQMCRGGTPLLYEVYPTTDHDGIIQFGNERKVQNWIAARFKGEQAPSNCNELPNASRKK
jgi:pimeloyl-ACP methyl ester carboxylesterase